MTWEWSGWWLKQILDTAYRASVDSGELEVVGVPSIRSRSPQGWGPQARSRQRGAKLSVAETVDVVTQSRSTALSIKAVAAQENLMPHIVHAVRVRDPRRSRARSGGLRVHRETIVV